MIRFSWRFIPIALFLFLILFLWRGLYLEPQQLPSVVVDKKLPTFHLPLLGASGKFSRKNFKNQVVLLIVWASWCESCEQEQVFLLELARQGLPIYGLNYKDETQNAKDWLAMWGNPFRLIGQDFEGKLAIDLGVYGVPESFIIDKKGFIRYRQTGLLTPVIWDKKLRPLIAQLEGEYAL